MAVSTPVKLAIIAASLMVMGLASRDQVAQQRWQGQRSTLSNYVASQFAQSTDDLEGASGYVSSVLKADPDNPVLLRHAFELNLGAGRIDVALDLAGRIYRTDPSSSTAGLLLMAEALRTGKLDEAERYTKGMATAGIEGFLVPIIRAWIAHDRNQPDQVQAELAKLDDVPAFRSYLREHRGYLALAEGKPREAVLVLTPLVAESTGGGMRVRQAIASALALQGDMATARSILESGRSIATAPLVDGLVKQLDERRKVDNPVASLRQGVAQLFLRTGIDLGSERATPLALVLLRLASHLAPEYPDVWLASADVLVQAEQNAAAFAALRRVPASSPLALEAALAMARIHDSAEASDQALAVLDDVLRRAPDSPAVVTQKADVLRRLERYDEAAALYTKALALTGPKASERWLLLYMRGVCFERAKQWDKAEADLQAARALRPDDPNILNYLAYSWVEQRRNLDEAKEMLVRAVALRPEDGFIIDSLGWAHYVAGDYEKAVQLLEQAVAAEPGDPTINDHLGDAYWKTGRILEARYRWKAALASKPEPERIAQIERKIDFGLTSLAGLN